MRVKFSMPAPIASRFAKEAFVANIGKTIDVVLDGSITRGLLTNAVVADDGESVMLTLDVDELTV